MIGFVGVLFGLGYLALSLYRYPFSNDYSAEAQNRRVQALIGIPVSFIIIVISLPVLFGGR